MFMHQELNYKVYNLDNLTYDEFIDIVNNSSWDRQVMVYDTETTGLSYITDTPFLLAFGFDGIVFYTVNVKDKVSWMYDVARTSTYLFAHNAKYDLHMMANIGKPIPEDINLADSMTVARLTSYADDRSGLALSKLATAYVHPKADYAEQVIKKLKNDINERRRKEARTVLKRLDNRPASPTDLLNAYVNRVPFVEHEWQEWFDIIAEIYKEPTYLDIYNEKPELMIAYAVDDIVLTLEYLKKALKVLPKVDINLNVFKQECELIRVVADMERQGFKADIDYLLESRKKVIDYQNKLYAKLHKLAGREFTVSQHKVILEILSKNFGIHLTSSDTQNIKKIIYNSTDEKAVEFAKTINKLRTVDKWLSTYIDGMLKRIVNGRIYADINNSGAVTGRVTSNFQQQPRDPLLDDEGNELFHPRKIVLNEEGSTLVFMDFSNMEMRVQAEYTVRVSGGDLALCRAFIPFKMKSIFTGKEFVYSQDDPYSGEWIDEDGNFWHPTDLHAATAFKAFPHLKKDDEDFKYYRNLGKRANFLKNYGGGVEALRDSLDVSYEIAQALDKGYYEAFPEIITYQRWVNTQLYNVGYVENLYGRRYYMRNSSEFYKCFNYLIQGSAADLVKEKQIEMYKYIKKHNLNTRLVYVIHDEIVMRVPHGEEEHIYELQKIANSDSKHMKHIPMICDVEYTTTNWAEKKEFKGSIE